MKKYIKSCVLLKQETQGPFSSMDMVTWYNCGYFAESLLLRRDCDDKFAKLGDLMRVFGRVPFLPGPPVPPLTVRQKKEKCVKRNNFFF